jgi:hypothetical protein
MMRRSMRFILRSVNYLDSHLWDKTTWVSIFLGEIKVETTHVGKKLPENNNLMQVELGEVVVIPRGM